MRHKNETATSFNELKEITLAIQAQKNSVQTNDNATQARSQAKARQSLRGQRALKKAL